MKLKLRREMSLFVTLAPCFIRTIWKITNYNVIFVTLPTLFCDSEWHQTLKAIFPDIWETETKLYKTVKPHGISKGVLLRFAFLWTFNLIKKICTFQLKIDEVQKKKSQCNAIVSHYQCRHLWTELHMISWSVCFFLCNCLFVQCL